MQRIAVGILAGLGGLAASLIAPVAGTAAVAPTPTVTASFGGAGQKPKPQDLKFTVPLGKLPGDLVTVKIKASPAVPGRKVTLWRLYNYNRIKVGSGAQNASGTVQISFRLAAAVDNAQLVATAAASRKLPAVTRRARLTVAEQLRSVEGATEILAPGTGSFAPSITADGRTVVVQADPTAFGDPPAPNNPASSFRNDGFGLYRLDLDTGAASPVTSPRTGVLWFGDTPLPYWSGPPRWSMSADGTTFLVDTPRWYVEDAPCSSTRSCPEAEYPDAYLWRGGQITRLTEAGVMTDDGGSQWTPGFHHALSASGDRAVVGGGQEPSGLYEWAVDLDQPSGRVPLPNGIEGRDVSRQSLSDDGKTLAFTRLVDHMVELYTVDLDAGAPQRVCDDRPFRLGDGGLAELALSDDGQTLVFQAEVPGTDYEDSMALWRCDLSTGQIEWIGRGAYPSVTPDGRYVAYVPLADVPGAHTDTTMSIRRFDAVTGFTEEVARAPRVARIGGWVDERYRPTISADGKTIAFLAGNGPDSEAWDTVVWTQD